MKYVIATIAALIILGGAYYFLTSNTSYKANVEEPERNQPETVVKEETEEKVEKTETKPEETKRSAKEVIGTSVEGNDIMAYHYGEGDTEVLLIGGIHGSYSKNTSALLEEANAYFKNNQDKVPESVTLTIIPNLNPDGLALSGTEGRFNANQVDLNRNFDCEWSETATWRNQSVSGGSKPFSEPEAAALQNYVLKYEPDATVVYFSAEGKVYPSACGTVPTRASAELAATYATAAGYEAEAEFDAYAITGDMVNWMAKQGLSAISVLLTDHSNTEWNKNQAGIEAVLAQYLSETE